ncbi:MAG: glutamate racemase [Anaerolineae bacterium]
MADGMPCGSIGLFDSGVGGLTVLREVLRQAPEADTIYLADDAHCPYGPRPISEIRAISVEISRYLLARGARCIVLACNTASAAALQHLRERFAGTPFVGMVPAVKPAAALTRSGVVGVLATPATLGGQLLAEVVERHAEGVRVLSQACPGLVEAIEAGELECESTDRLLERYLQPLLDQGADTLVLGCTHYPFLAPAIQRLAGPNVRLLDPSEAVARQVCRVAGKQRNGERRRTFLCTGRPEPLQAAARHLLGLEVTVEKVTWHEGHLPPVTGCTSEGAAG